MLNKFNIPFNLEQAVDIDTEGQGLCSKEGQPDKVYWVDGNDITDADLKFINLCCKQGGTVIVDSLQPDGAVALSKLTGNDIILERTFATELIKKKDSILLMDGISNDDLYWRQSPDFYKDAFARSIGKKYISKDISMIDYAIKENKHISVPVKPGGIGIMPYIDGKIIMFTIKWSDFLKIRTVKVSRTLVSLLHNLGVFTEDNNSNLKNWIYIDLKSFMDREFWKKEKNTLAWFDKGNDDMRYFPVNRPGIDATLNLPQPPEKFPANPVLLGNVSFKLENPDHNSGKGCLLLRKGEQLVLPINAIYDKMWMLGALESNDKKGETVATVIFNYTNNSKEQVEIKAGIHVNGYQYSDDTEKGIIAWIGNNPARRNNVLWCWSIQNPQPNHEVKSITLTNGNRKQFIIIAVTLENNR